MHITLIATCLAAITLSLPDVIMPGTRGIRVEQKLDAAPLIDGCCVQYVVTKGDTYSRIAATRLGSITRVQEIVQLNPDLDPRRLRIGERIWLPPKTPPAKGTEAKETGTKGTGKKETETKASELTYVYLAPAWPFREDASPFAPTDSVPAPRYGRFAFLLVPASQLEAFAAAQQNRDRQETRALAAAGKIDVLLAECPGRHVAEGHPMYERHDTFVVERDDQGRFSIRVESVAFDKDGKVIDPSIGATGGDERPGKESLWLLLLTAAGGGWLVWRRGGDQAHLTTARA